MTDAPSAEFVAAVEATACPHCNPTIEWRAPVGDRWVIDVHHQATCAITQAALADTTGRVAEHARAALEENLAALGYAVGADVPDFVPEDFDDPA